MRRTTAYIALGVLVLLIELLTVIWMPRSTTVGSMWFNVGLPVLLMFGVFRVPRVEWPLVLVMAATFFFALNQRTLVLGGYTRLLVCCGAVVMIRSVGDLIGAHGRVVEGRSLSGTSSGS